MTVPGESTFWYYIIVNSLIAVTVFFVFVFLNEFLRHIKYPFSSKGVEDDSCSSPNCIRCRSSLLEKELLLIKLREYLHESVAKPEDLDRLNESIIEGTRVVDYKRSCSPQRPTTLALLGLNSKPWHDGVYSCDIQELCSEANIDVITSEVETVIKDLSEGWVHNTSPSGSWYIFHLYNQGEKVENNCRRCPQTTALVEKVRPFMTGCAFGNAVISVITPGTLISPHYGPTNCRVRCHVPLVVPSGCKLKVDLEERQWRRGVPLVFDDSFLHEVSHSGPSGRRIVLMLDLWHPDVSVAERKAICHLFSNFNWIESSR